VTGSQTLQIKPAWGSCQESVIKNYQCWHPLSPNYTMLTFTKTSPRTCRDVCDRVRDKSVTNAFVSLWWNLVPYNAQAKLATKSTK